MRVVAGTLRGRRFEAPTGSATRPTTDKVREAVFNALGSLGVVTDARVADLFAGSGGLGIEALSRGASHVTFVEQDRTAVAVLRSNVRSLGLDRSTRVVPGDAIAVLPGLDVDLVLADPPYGFDRWDDLLAVVRRDVVRCDVVVAEADRPVDGIAGWETVRSKRYGRTWVTFLRRAEEPAPGVSSTAPLR